ncbi:hypothetical protein EX30DRAFT_344478 [Ascodesmis nigricans]|uniref:Endo-1,3(4)-beta-glucanase 1 carbohydrate binding domain-containing protein n=1 Tax=Ascodesmis nigricans TaxID=341454 RepID=A0A4S2MR26_9PEZI|nr:hypothetical protein EX30DRAFT_344478 [Ascodesmis nigricans]
MHASTFFTVLVAVAATARTADAASLEKRSPQHVPIDYVGKVLYCGDKPYYEGFYQCHSHHRLCPIINGYVYEACGYGNDMACYRPDRHGCVKNRLVNIKECGANVYDDNSFTCALNIGGPGKTVCPIERPASCDGVCYSPSTDRCVDGKLVRGSIDCPNPNYPNQCGGSCFPPIEQWMCDMDVMMIPARTCSRFDIPM